MCSGCPAACAVAPPGLLRPPVPLVRHDFQVLAVDSSHTGGMFGSPRRPALVPRLPDRPSRTPCMEPAQSFGRCLSTALDCPGRLAPLSRRPDRESRSPWKTQHRSQVRTTFFFSSGGQRDCPACPTRTPRIPFWGTKFGRNQSLRGVPSGLPADLRAFPVPRSGPGPLGHVDPSISGTPKPTESGAPPTPSTPLGGQQGCASPTDLPVQVAGKSAGLGG